MDPKIQRLAEQPLLAGFSDRDLKRLATLFDEVELPSGTVLMHQGRRGDETFFLEHGEVSVEIDGQEVARLGRGDVVGELAPLDRRQRSATVTALTDVRAFVVSPRQFSGIRHEPVVASRLSEILASRLRSADAGFVSADDAK
jgi:CRP-like cAMP-binding protein